MYYNKHLKTKDFKRDFSLINDYEYNIAKKLYLIQQALITGENVDVINASLSELKNNIHNFFYKGKTN